MFTAPPPVSPPPTPDRPANAPAPGGSTSYNPYDTAAWRTTPAPDQSLPHGGPYSGQFPAQEPPPPPRRSGPLPTVPNDAPAYRRSGQFPTPPADQNRGSGAFAAPPSTPYQSGAYVVPPDAAPGAYNPAASGQFPYPRARGQTGQFSIQAPAQSPPVRVRQSGPIGTGELTSTGSRRVVVAPDAGERSILTDRPALAFLVTALLLVGAMIAYIAARYMHFPAQIAFHFGPAGSSQPNRIGDKRELWTIPFIVGIVLAANTALAWALHRYDRFAARLLTLGSAVVAAIAWVVFLTLLHR